MYNYEEQIVNPAPSTSFVNPDETTGTMISSTSIVSDSKIVATPKRGKFMAT